MGKFERGKPISAGALNRTEGQADTGANLSSQTANVDIGPGGQSLHVLPTEAVPTGAVRARGRLTTAGDVDRWRLVEIHGAFTGKGQVEPVLDIRKPQIPGNNALAITLEPIRTNGIGLIAIGGYAPLYFTDHPRPLVSGSGAPGDYYPVTSGMRIGTMGAMTNDYYGHWQPLGPIELAQLWETVAVDGYTEGGACSTWDVYLGLAQITGDRGDAQLVEDDAQCINKPFSVFYFDTNFELSETGALTDCATILVELA